VGSRVIRDRPPDRCHMATTRQCKRRADATLVAADAKKSFCDEGFRHFPEVGVVKSMPKF
jgi:hypothetical protein